MINRLEVDDSMSESCFFSSGLIKKSIEMFSEFNKSYLNSKDVENDINQCNVIKYAAYRAAAKLRVVQRAFYLDKVRLKVITCVLGKHQLQQTENSVELDQEEVESVLSDIYFVSKKENDIQMDVNYISHMLFKFLLEVYERKTLNMVQVLSLKVALTLLCNAKPREKYHYLFEQLADHNNCLSRKKLEIILTKMIKLTEYLGEGFSFGFNLIAGTVESCFQYNTGGLRLSEDVFMKWLMQDPQLLVWLSTLYRIQISESVSHNVKCTICKICPLVGLRYRCLRCLSFNMCMSCFFTGKMSKKHKLKHPVQEYCCAMTSQQTAKAFFLILKNMLYKKNCKLQYLPALRISSFDTESLNQTARLLDGMGISSKTVFNGSRISLHRLPYRELQNIILQLVKEGENLISQIDNFCLRAENSEVNETKIHMKNYFMKHKAQVVAQVERLKLFEKLLRSCLEPKVKDFAASTPVAEEILSESQEKYLKVDLSDLSPIPMRTHKKKEGRIKCYKRMMCKNYDLDALGPNSSWEKLQSLNVESRSFESEISNTNNIKTAKQTIWRRSETELEKLSTWLTEKTIRELNSSSRKGITWLYENDSKSLKEENETTLEELQSDLKKILDKLQEFSVLVFKEEVDKIESLVDKQSTEICAVEEVDNLLVDLIDGVQKLNGS